MNFVSFRQRDRFEDMLRSLIPEKSSISGAMVFCIEHAEAAAEICECLSESLCIPETPLSKKVFAKKQFVSTLKRVTSSSSEECLVILNLIRVGVLTDCSVIPRFGHSSQLHGESVQRIVLQKRVMKATLLHGRLSLKKLVPGFSFF